MGHREVASVAALGGISVAVASFYWLSRPKQSPTEAPSAGQHMRRLVVTQPDETFEKVRLVVEQVPVPKVEYGQVLVKMEAVPVVRVFVRFSKVAGKENLSMLIVLLP